MGLPRCSNRRRCLLVEATQLAWASLAATTSPFSPINRGKRVEQIRSTLLVSNIHLKLVRKIVSVKKIQAEALPQRFRDVSVGDFVKIFHRYSSFFVLSSSFFGLQPVSSRNRTFQFILCTLRGPFVSHAFTFISFTFRTPF